MTAMIVIRTTHRTVKRAIRIKMSNRMTPAIMKMDVKVISLLGL